MRISHVLRASVTLLVGSMVLFGQGSGPRPPQLSELAQGSKRIVDATVEKVSNNSVGLPRVTDNVMRVSRVLKGVLPEERIIVLTTLPNQAMKPGERYILFLRDERTVIPPPQIKTYSAVNRVNAVKVADGEKLEINPAMPFYKDYNGKTLGEFLDALQAQIH